MHVVLSSSLAFISHTLLQAELLSEQQEHDKKIGGMEKKNASDREALNGGVNFEPQHSEFHLFSDFHSDYESCVCPRRNASSHQGDQVDPAGHDAGYAASDNQAHAARE